VIQSDTLWWEEIVGPSRFLSDIESALYSGRSLLIHTPCAFPYRESFSAALDHRLGNNAIPCVRVDCSMMDGKGDPYRYLIEQTGQPRQILSDYLRQKSQSCAKFLRASGMISGKVIWLHGIPEGQLKLWLRLVSMHASASLDHGVFLIETTGGTSESRGQITALRYGDYVTADDLRLFISTLAAHLFTLPHDALQYLIELTTSLCQTDSELAEVLIADPDALLQNPLARLSDVCCEFGSDRGEGDAGHPCTLIAANKSAVLNRRVWAAQVRVGYPRIEISRLELIEKWYPQIQEALGTTYRDPRDGTEHYFINYEKKRITDPYDLEIGMLAQMNSLRRFSDPGSYLLYFPADDYELTRQLRDCRNALAHLTVCAYDLFSVLISG